MTDNTLSILKPSVNNLTARIFVRAAGLEYEELDVWGKKTTPEFLAKDPADLTPLLEEEGLPKGALIPNKLQKRGRLSREMLGAVNKLKIPVLAGLSLRQAFADAAGQAKTVSDMGTPAFLASFEMKQLLKEMTRG